MEDFSNIKRSDFVLTKDLPPKKFSLTEHIQKYFKTYSIAIIIASSISFIVYLYSLTEEVSMEATVIAHTVSFNKHGQRTYVTIIKTKDGWIEEKKGISLYALPVGAKTVVTVVREKKD